jgi:outer membrane assembly lipoprotein YfiO
MRFLPIAFILLAASCAAQPPSVSGGATGDGLAFDRDLGWYKGEDLKADSPPKRFREAKQLFDGGDYEGAADAFDRWITDFQNNSLICSALFYYAESLYNTGDYAEAYQYYKKIMDDAPDFERIADVQDRVQMMGFAALNGKIEDADFGMRVLEDLVIAYPYEHFSAVVLYDMAEYYMKNGDYHSATEAFMAVERRYPDSVQAEDSAFKAALCSSRLSKGPDYDLRYYLAARRLYKMFLAQYPNSIKAKDAEKAVDELDELLAESEISAARFYLSEGKPFAARLVLEGVVRDYPGKNAAKTAENELKNIPLKTFESAEKEFLDKDVQKVPEKPAPGAEGKKSE